MKIKLAPLVAKQKHEILSKIPTAQRSIDDESAVQTRQSAKKVTQVYGQRSSSLKSLGKVPIINDDLKTAMNSNRQIEVQIPKPAKLAETLYRPKEEQRPKDNLMKPNSRQKVNNNL